MSAQSDCVLAIDIGGTFIKSAIISSTGVISHEIAHPTKVQAGQALSSLMDVINAQYQTGSPITAIGIVAAGVVNPATGVIVHAANLGWHGIPIVDLVSEHIHAMGFPLVPISLENDVVSGGIAEARLGAGKDCDHFLFLPLGTGIAGAIMINGEPFRGGVGAGEIGHMIVQPGGIPCNCGGHGCLERYCSASALVHAYNVSNPQGVPITGAEEVFLKLQENDSLAQQVWDNAMDYLLLGIVNYCTILGPKRIIIGGGLAKSGEVLLRAIETKLADYPLLFPRPEICLAQLSDKSGEIGAALIAWDSLDRVMDETLIVELNIA